MMAYEVKSHKHMINLLYINKDSGFNSLVGCFHIIISKPFSEWIHRNIHLRVNTTTPYLLRFYWHYQWKRRKQSIRAAFLCIILRSWYLILHDPVQYKFECCQRWRKWNYYLTFNEFVWILLCIERLARSSISMS